MAKTIQANATISFNVESDTNGNVICPFSGVVCNNTKPDSQSAPETESTPAPVKEAAKPVVPVVIPAPVKLPTVKAMREKLLKLQKDEYWKYYYSKDGKSIKDNIWSFRSTARTMLKKRIEALRTEQEVRDIIRDIYGPTPDAHKHPALTLEEWVTKNF